MLSWFGAVRMKRKPLKYVEQRRLVHFHTHQKRFGEMAGKRHFVSLPDPVPISDSVVAGGDTAAQLETPTAAASKLPGTQLPPQPQNTPQRTGGPAGVNQVAPSAVPKPLQPVAQMQQPMGMGPRQTMMRQPQPQPQMWTRGPIQANQQPNRMQMILKKIQKDQIEHEQRRIVTPYGGHPMPRAYPMMGQMQQRPQHMGAYAGLNAMQQQQQRARQMHLIQTMTPEQRQVYLQRMRIRQQQAQHAAAMNQGMMGATHYANQYPPQQVHPQMSMQPMQVQQPMQHGYNQQQMMVQQQQYAQQQPGAPPPMNPMQRPMY